jgi:serine/threonine protein kinase
MSSRFIAPGLASEADPILTNLVEEFADRLLAGEAVDVESFVARHPDHAEQLRRFLPAAQVLADLGRSLASGSGAPGESVPPADALTGTLGDFRIVREIGRGGMGVVYEADQISLGRRVALKVLPFAGAMDARALQRFQNEARASACLHHPNIVPVYAVGQDRGVHFYAMQFIEGQSLDAVLGQLRRATDPDATTAAPRGKGAAQPAAETKREPAAQASTLPSPRQGREYYRRIAELGIAAAEALEHAHQLGIIHRDVKPANLMLDGRGQLWVTDFGLAQFQSDARLTMTGDLMGTLRYMSPEQALAQRVIVDQRTDVYSLGATLYELLTQQPVFTRQDRHELLRQIAFEDPTPPRRVNRTIPTELETIVLKALEKNPQERYASAGELAADLRRYLEEQPIAARRPAIVDRARKWARRHQPFMRALVAALMVSVVALAASTAWALHMNAQTETALTETETQRRAAEAARLKEGQERVKAEQAQKNEERERKKAEQAAEDERKAKQVADERRQQGEAVADLLESLFKNLNPRAKQSGEWDLREALVINVDKAAALLERESLDPLAQARVQNAMGLAFMGLGEPKKAVIQFQGSLEKFRATLGPDHPKTLTSMGNLASAYGAAGQLAKALALHEETLAKHKTLLGVDHPDTLESMNSLAVAYHDMGQLAKAAALHEETFAKRKANLGENHLSTLTTMHNLASTYQAADQLSKALPLHEEATAKLKALLGADHPDTLTSMNSLATAYHASGQLKTALDLHDEVLQIKKTQLGTDHPSTLQSMNNLAAAYRDAGQMEKALSLHEETLVKCKAKLGADHPYTLATMNYLALAYLAAGQQAKALTLCEETLAKRKNSLGADHPDTLNSMNNLAEAYLKAGKFGLALALHEEALAKTKGKFGADHRDTLTSMHNLASTYHSVGQLSKAVALYEEALANRKAHLGADHPHTLATMNNLALAYQAMGALKKALALHEETLAKRETHLGSEHPDTLISMHNLAPGYHNAGQLSKALPLYEKALAKIKAKVGAVHPDTLIAMLLNLANAYAGSGQLDKAETVLREVAAAQSKAWGATHLKTANALGMLGLCLLMQHKFAEAEPVLRNCLEIQEQKLPNNLAAFSIKSMLGGSLLGQKKYTEAEPLLLEGYFGMHLREKSIPPPARPRLLEAAERIVELYDAWDRKD